MIWGGLALMAVSLPVADAPSLEEEPTSTEAAIDARTDRMQRAIDDLNAKRAVPSPSSSPSPLPFDLTIDQPPLPAPTALPTADRCSGPLCTAELVPQSGPLLYHDPRGARGDGPAADTRPSFAEQIEPLVPVAMVLAGFGFAFALYRFLRPRWRRLLSVARRIGSAYWREIGVFTMLAAILFKLW